MEKGRMARRSRYHVFELERRRQRELPSRLDMIVTAMNAFVDIDC